MKISRRQLIETAAAGAALYGIHGAGWAQGYPARPVRIVVGFPPGGTSDIAARLLGQSLSERLGQPIVVDNRPGAGANIATESVVNAPADGYTILLINAANAINVTLYDKLSFNFIRDIAPVAGLIRAPLVMVVHPAFAARTVPEFVAKAKTSSDNIAMATAGTGTSPHVTGEMFKMMSGISMVNVPYRGATPALTDLMAGQVQVMFATIASSIGYIKAGKLRPLAVTTTTRSEALPGTPVMSDFLPGYEASDWYGVGAPKDTPAGIVEKLNKEINSILADSKIKIRLAELGGAPFIISPADFRKMIAEETAKWARVVKFSGAKAD